MSVCLLSQPGAVSKRAEAIDMPFGMWSRGGPGNHVLGGPSSAAPRKRAFGGEGVIQASRQCLDAAYFYTRLGAA